jgi:integrase
MKLELTTDLIPKMTLDAFPEPGVPFKQWKPADGPNYLVYDTSRKAPTGFAIRVGKKASVYIVEKQVNNKNMKIHVGLARGRKGDEQVIDLDTARDKARELIAVAKKHGANPKVVGERIEASELSLGQVWNQYIADLTGRSKPIKPNSLDSLKKARDKFKDWEDRKVRLITAQEILDRFDLHAVTKAHRTAAEAMGRWATAAVANAIENEVHNAHAEGRAPSLTYNPFTILKTKQKYRDHNQLERDYKAKGVRNPLSFAKTVGPFVKAAWEYRAQNPVAADFILLDLLWGLRGDECRSVKWRDQITDARAVTDRWIDMTERVVRINDAKNRGDHEFPIGPCAYELLKLRRESQIKGEVWVFPAMSPNSLKGHYSDPSVALKTVRVNAGIKVVRGHDLRRTFGAACEKLGLTDRQIKRLLGHGVAGGETLGRYTSPEWQDTADRMMKVEEEILKVAPSVYNALRPRGAQRFPDTEVAVIDPKPKGRPSQRKPR